MIRTLHISEKELAMRCACDFCAHCDLTKVINSEYVGDIENVTFDGEEANIYYTITFDEYKAVSIRCSAEFDDWVETNGNVKEANKAALKLINTFIAESDYQIKVEEEEKEEDPYHYLTA